ncbi:MAG: DUF2141 domain-containing protein [Bacteroidetes bacterium]|nr:DUF2141 domain-containing protein [Bacteroidota bacterium]
MNRFSLSLVCLLCYNFSSAQQQGELTVRVGHFIQPKGNVVVLLFDSLSRLKGKGIPVQTASASINSAEATVVFSNLQAGRYAVSAFQDLDSNGKLEFEKEDFGMSNGALAKFGPPTFHAMAFSFDGSPKQIYVQLENEKANRSALYVGRNVFTPVFGYTPETSLMVGANLIDFFRLNKLDTTSRISFVDVLGAVTLHKQVITEINYTFFTNREKYMLIGNMGFQKFPQYYYGIGNDLPESNKESINYDQFVFSPLFLRNLYKKVFAGVGYYYLNLFNLKDGSLNLLDNNQVTGYQGSTISGIQFCVTSDNRNNIYNTSKGHLVRFKYGVNNGALGSEFDFRSFEGDLRKFIKLNKESEDIIALQLYSYFTWGTVPWNAMGALGNDMIMRGYYSGRYRDRNYAAAQVEYRRVINKMFGLVFYAGTGEVASELNQFSFQGLKPNGGIGFRLKMARSERVNLRMDLGFGKGTSNFYLNIAEAF